MKEKEPRVLAASKRPKDETAVIFSVSYGYILTWKGHLHVVQTWRPK